MRNGLVLVLVLFSYKFSIGQSISSESSTESSIKVSFSSEQDIPPLSIFPTKVIEILNVRNVHFKFRGGVLRIFSLTGEQVYFKLIDDKDLKIFTSTFQPGLYFISLTKGKDRYSFKFTRE